MVGCQPNYGTRPAIIIVYSTGALTSATQLTNSETSVYTNYPSTHRREPPVFVVEYVWKRGHRVLKAPELPADVDPWTPPQLAPRVALPAWPTMIRRFRAQRS